jgi:nucleoside diphosphate kinase
MCVDEVIKRMQESGFAVLGRKEMTLTPELAEQFYRDQKDKPHFDDLIQHMTRYGHQTLHRTKQSK